MDRREAMMYSVKADTYDNCIEKIKQLHGNNYAITKKRAVKIGGFLGFFEKDGYELEYTVMPEPNPVRFSGQGAAAMYGALPMYGYDMPRQNVPQHNTAGMSNVPSRENVRDFDTEKKKIIEKNGILPNPQIREVLDEVRALRDELSSSALSARDEEHPTITKILQMLDNNEFTLTYARSIISRLKKDFSFDELEDFDMIQRSVVDWIGESIHVNKPVYTARPQIIMLVGPTGVGKTTTVAKIAARFVCPPDNSSRPKNVRIITTDSFRIAAKQQIEIYGNHMDIPVACADTNDDLIRHIQQASTDVDYILIDTIGYSPKDYENIAKMRKILDIRGAAVQTYLTMTASTKISDMRDIIRQYETFGYSSIIITKFDETNHIGNVISALAEKGKTVSYITTGQHVPRNFEEASIVRFLMQLADFKIDRNHIEERFLRPGV